MAIGYLNVAIIGRSSGRSAVAAAAYASRTDLVDERTGTAYRYARKSGDLVTSFVWLPKGAPERLRDRAALWNEVEKAETRKNSQTARRIIMALPHELTAKQQQQLLQDFIKENFTRKGLAVDASIHEPDAKGDERNDHAHLLIPTRFMDKDGLGKKDRESNDRAALDQWRASWVKLANRQLERYGHAVRITFEVEEGQTPQNHMGPEATALERQGVETRAGDYRLDVVNDNEQGRGVANDLQQIVAEVTESAAVAPASYQPGTMAEVEQAGSSAASFLLGLFTSWAESITSSVTRTRRSFQQRSVDKTRQREKERAAQVQRMEAQRQAEQKAEAQTRERESFEPQRAANIEHQQTPRGHYEQQYAEPSALQQSFDIHTRSGDRLRAELDRMVERNGDREHGRRHDGPELG